MLEKKALFIELNQTETNFVNGGISNIAQKCLIVTGGTFIITSAVIGVVPASIIVISSAASSLTMAYLSEWKTGSQDSAWIGSTGGTVGFSVFGILTNIYSSWSTNKNK